MNVTKESTTPQVGYSFITTLLFWCGLVIVASNYLTIPLMTIFSNVFNTKISYVAWTGSAFSFCYAIGSLFSGPLSDHFGRKQVILTGLCILTFITLVIPIYSNLFWVIGLRSIQGFAAASFAPVAIAFVVDKFPARKVVTTIGFISSGFLISGIVGQIFSNYMSHQFGWQSVFYYTGLIYLFTAFLVHIFLPTTNTQQQDIHLKTMFQQFQKLLTDKNLIRAYLITITLLLTFVAFYTILGDYLIETFEMNEDNILYVRLVGIVGMLLAPFAGTLANRYGVIPILRSGLILAVLGISIVGLYSNLFFLVLMSVVFVAGIAITVPTLISLVGELGGENHGAAVSLYAFILFIGTSLGPLITVSLLKTGSYFIAFELLALVLGLSLIISFFIKIKTD